MLLDDFRIPGNHLKVRGNLELRSEDIAGETCGTDAVDKGVKPKILRVSVEIPFASSKDLLNLVKTAEAKDKNGDRVIYTISHRSATSAGIRQVRFTDHFNWNESGTLLLWAVSFTLQEYLSNPERAEKREDNSVVSDTTQYQTILDQAEGLA